MSNIPPGVTPRDIDNLCSIDRYQPNQQECILCSRVIEQDHMTRQWFDADEFAYFKPFYRSDFLNSFETQAGWVCSTDCYNERCIVGPPAPKLFLVGGSR